MTRARVRSEQHHYTFSDYIALEEASNTKHEFLDGEIFAMAGGTPTHAELSVTVGSLLWQQLRGTSCRVFSSDLRVRVLATGLAAYPDVTVVCGEAAVVLVAQRAPSIEVWARGSDGAWTARASGPR